MASRFWVGGTGTWDNADTTHWAATSNGAGGASVPIAGDTVTLDGSSGGGTVTVNHATLNVASLTMGAFTGTLDFATNDNNITITGAFSGSGTGTRTLNMGDGTWTMSATTGSFLWDCSTVTNFTLNANGSTIAVTGTAPTNMTFFGGGKTYNILTLGAVTTGATWTFAGSNTFATLNVTAPRNLMFANQSSITTTITNAFNWNGDASNLFTVGSIFGSTTIVATGGGTINYGVLFNITYTTGTVNATNSYDLRSNAGVTITAPSGGVTARVIGG